MVEGATLPSSLPALCTRECWGRRCGRCVVCCDVCSEEETRKGGLLPQPIWRRAKPVVIPNLLLVDPAVELVVLPNVEHARLRDGDPIPPLLRRYPPEAALHKRVNHLVRHHVV